MGGGRQRSGLCARDMTGEKLRLWPDVEKHDTPAFEAVNELIRRELLDLIAVSEVLVREDCDLGYVHGRDVPHRGPELRNPLAREPVVDAPTISTGAGEAALGEQS